MGRSGGIHKKSARTTQSRSRIDPTSGLAKLALELKISGLTRSVNQAKKLLESDRPIDRFEGESKMLDIIENLSVDPSRPEIKQFLIPYLAAAREGIDLDTDNLSDTEVLRLYRWQGAVEKLLDQETLNSANAFSILADANGDQVETWMRDRISKRKGLGSLKEIKSGDKENISFQTHLIEGVLAVENDPAIKSLDRLLREREDDIRDQASVLGNRPMEDLVVVPHAGWVGPSRDKGAIAHHCYSDGTDYGIDSEYVLIYAGQIRDSSGDIENGTNYTEGDMINTARHELIHAAQAEYYQSDRPFREECKKIGIESRHKQDQLAKDLKEALTESLNIIRAYPHVRDNFSRESISTVDCSYRDHVVAMSDALAQSNVGDRAQAIELLNSFGPGEVVKGIDHELGKAGRSSQFLSMFLEAISE